MPESCHKNKRGRCIAQAEGQSFARSKGTVGAPNFTSDHIILARSPSSLLYWRAVIIRPPTCTRAARDLTAKLAVVRVEAVDSTGVNVQLGHAPTCNRRREQSAFPSTNRLRAPIKIKVGGSRSRLRPDLLGSPLRSPDAHYGGFAEKLGASRRAFGLVRPEVTPVRRIFRQPNAASPAVSDQGRFYQVKKRGMMIRPMAPASATGRTCQMARWPSVSMGQDRP